MQGSTQSAQASFSLPRSCNAVVTIGPQHNAQLQLFVLPSGTGEVQNTPSLTRLGWLPSAQLAVASIGGECLLFAGAEQYLSGLHQRGQAASMG